MDRRAWRAAVHGGPTELDTTESTHTGDGDTQPGAESRCSGRARVVGCWASVLAPKRPL